ncbi:LRP2-binding protein-like [Centruroides vittatus]|uniref:LRP2-binding protein-like n=1 Tax=Centruroides vittatus TaxID=120091 RepID=UPI00350FA14B
MADEFEEAQMNKEQSKEESSDYDGGLDLRGIDTKRPFKIDYSCEKDKIKKKKKRLEALRLAREHFDLKQYSMCRFMIEKIPNIECSAEAMFMLGVLYFDGLAVQKDQAKALQIMIRIALMKSYLQEEEDFIVQAQFNVGEAYFYGTGTLNNDAEAEKWWHKAALKKRNPGAIRAQSALGKFYSRRLYFFPDKSFYWHSKACENGSLESQTALGIMYFYGIGVEKNEYIAYKHLSSASHRGSVMAMAQMMVFYYQRRLYQSTAQLGKQLCKYFDILEISRNTECSFGSIVEGLCIAYFYLGRCYHRGAGIEQNIEKALDLYKKATEYSARTASQLHTKLLNGLI